MTQLLDSTVLAFIGSPGPWQVLMVALVILVLFGHRLPSVMRSLGEGITEFKKGIKTGDSDTAGEIEDRSDSRSNTDSSRSTSEVEDASEVKL